MCIRDSSLTGPVDEYCPPFGHLVPPNPSVEDMKEVVVKQHLRPTIPKTFTDHLVSHKLYPNAQIEIISMFMYVFTIPLPPRSFSIDRRWLLL